MPTKKEKKNAELFLNEISGTLTLFSLVEAIREGEEWTKKKMADELNVSPTYYSDFISGNKPVSPQKAASWASHLGYDKLQFVELAIQDQLERYNLPYKVKLFA